MGGNGILTIRLLTLDIPTEHVILNVPLSSTDIVLGKTSK